MKKRHVLGLVLVAMLGLLPATAVAGSFGQPGGFRGGLEQRSVFPTPPDPWRHWGSWDHGASRPRVGSHRGGPFSLETPVVPPVIVVTPPPAFWVPGHWAWNGFAWLWVPGYWTW